MFDKLYYIFHCSMKNGFAHAERASFLLSFSVWIYIGALCFLVMIIANSIPDNPLIGCGVFVASGVGFIYFTSWYFVGSGRYRRIIEKYGNPRSLNRKTRLFYRFISIGLFFLGSFAAFAILGILLSRHLNPW